MHASQPGLWRCSQARLRVRWTSWRLVGEMKICELLKEGEGMGWGPGKRSVGKWRGKWGASWSPSRPTRLLQSLKHPQMDLLMHSGLLGCLGSWSDNNANLASSSECVFLPCDTLPPHPESHRCSPWCWTSQSCSQLIDHPPVAFRYGRKTGQAGGCYCAFKTHKQKGAG